MSEKEAFYWWFTGFIEAQGTFIIDVNHRKNRKSPSIRARLQVVSHKRELQLLWYIQKEMRIGRVYKFKNGTVSLHVSKKDDVKRLIDIFDSHSFRSARMRKNFELFKEGFEILLRRDEREFETDEDGKKRPKLTVDEIRRLEKIRNDMNLYCGAKHGSVQKKYHDSILDLF